MRAPSPIAQHADRLAAIRAQIKAETPTRAKVTPPLVTEADLKWAREKTAFPSVVMADHGLSTIEVAGRVRMLMRDDWTHEMVCMMGRDRIARLVVQNANLLAALKALLDAHESDLAPPWETARTAIAAAEASS